MNITPITTIANSVTAESPYDVPRSPPERVSSADDSKNLGNVVAGNQSSEEWWTSPFALISGTALVGLGFAAAVYSMKRTKNVSHLGNVRIGSVVPVAEVNPLVLRGVLQNDIRIFSTLDEFVRAAQDHYKGSYGFLGMEEHYLVSREPLRITNKTVGTVTWGRGTGYSSGADVTLQMDKGGAEVIVSSAAIFDEHGKKRAHTFESSPPRTEEKFRAFDVVYRFGPDGKFTEALLQMTSYRYGKTPAGWNGLIVNHVDTVEGYRPKDSSVSADVLPDISVIRMQSHSNRVPGGEIGLYGHSIEVQLRGMPEMRGESIHEIAQRLAKEWMVSGRARLATRAFLIKRMDQAQVRHAIIDEGWVRARAPQIVDDLAHERRLMLIRNALAGNRELHLYDRAEREKLAQKIAARLREMSPEERRDLDLKYYPAPASIGTSIDMVYGEWVDEQAREMVAERGLGGQVDPELRKLAEQVLSGSRELDDVLEELAKSTHTTKAEVADALRGGDGELYERIKGALDKAGTRVLAEKLAARVKAVDGARGRRGQESESRGGKVLKFRGRGGR